MLAPINRSEQTMAVKNKKYLFCVIVLALLMLSVSGSGIVFAHTLPLNLMPMGTELAEQKEETQENCLISKYQFRSQSSKESIMEFYRKMFTNQGFQEVEATPPLKASLKFTYFFTKENQMILVSFSNKVEEGTTTYYVHVHEVGPITGAR
ncbi:MAG: hypothetical protein PHV55_07815 [Candidatus Omnitrophica bacterium]|nr:hypothetical protein [Candidatus Omnitrophota bacterium]